MQVKPTTILTNGTKNVLVTVSVLVIVQLSGYRMLLTKLQSNGRCPMTEVGVVNDPERCPRTKHVDGKSHGWLFWGDDPYIKCDWCGEIRDALTGRVVK